MTKIDAARAKARAYARLLRANAAGDDESAADARSDYEDAQIAYEEAEDEME
ncbi:MAG TPA: hypothetical protein VII92_08115 [Anaerolineae bacterium]